MTRIETGLWLCSFMVILFVSSTLPAFARDERMGVVHMSKLFDEYEKTKEFDRKFQTEGRLKQEERDAMVHELQRLRDERELLAEDQRSDKDEEIEAKLKQLDAFDIEVRRSLGKQRDAAIREVFQDIEKVLDRYGERKGYDLIINERALLYANNKLDVTADVLKELNSDYKKKSG